MRDVARLRLLKIVVGEQEYECSVKSGFLVGSKVQVYFLDKPGMYPKPRPDLNCTGDNEKGDFHQCLALLNHAALQLMMLLNWTPDVIHCNGWQTALTPYLIKHRDIYSRHFNSAFTIVHPFSLNNQILIQADKAEEMGLLPEEVNIGGILNSDGRVSFLKAGLKLADIVMTTNKMLIEEAESQTPEVSALLQTLEKRKDVFHLIRNGIEMDEWDPSIDKKIAYQFKSENVEEGKNINRDALRRRWKLFDDPKIPLIAMISRIIDQKGLKKLEKIAAKMFSTPVKFLISGARDPERENLLKSWAEKHQDKVGVSFTTSEAFERQLIAGADMFLLPTYNEASRRYLAYVMNYGTLPILCDHHEMVDMIEDCGFEDGYRFTFPENDYNSIITVLNDVADYFNDRTKWINICQKVMEPDFSWGSVADKYIRMYLSVNERADNLAER